MLLACAGALTGLHALAAEKADSSAGRRLGVVIHSYGLRSAASKAEREPVPFDDPLRFLQYCGQLGAGGVQVALGIRDAEYTARLRAQAETNHLFLEGSIRLPQGRADVDRFGAEVRTARECGARVLRSALLNGRRYETFSTAAEFRHFAERAYESLGLAEPVVARQDLRLAIENHKDWRTGELLDLLKRLGSRHVGVCVDTGNSMALLEDPLAVVEAYAPWAFSTHLKDMAVEEYAEGFLLAEVPLGTGFLDLKKMVAVLRQAQPELHFNLEMITRDPLRVPCLSEAYCATLGEVPARDLVRTLVLVRRQAAKKPLPRISGLAQDKQLAREESNVRRSLAHARKHLGL